MRRTRTRRGVIGLAGVLVGVGVLVAPPPAGADHGGSGVAPAGPLSMAIVDGVLDIGALDPIPLSCTPDDPELEPFVPEDCDPEAEPITLVGEVDGGGHVTVPQAGASFPPGEPVEIPGLATIAFGIEAQGDATGTVDPEAGTFSLDWSLASVIEVTDSPFVPDGTCTVPLDLEFAGSYDPAAGRADVDDDSFEIVQGDLCTDPALDAVVPSLIGDTSSGNNRVRYVLDLDPVITGGGGEEGPPLVGNTAASVGSGGSVSRTIPVTANPAATCVLDPAPDGGASLAASVELVGFTITYVHDPAAGQGVDTVGYRCDNALGSDSGTLTVDVLGDACQAECSLQQVIEVEIVGGSLTMEQDAAEVALEDITLNGGPQVTSGQMNQITVVNARGDGQRWDLTGQTTPFTTQGHGGDCAADDESTWDFRCIPGNNLGWNPDATVAHDQVPGDVAAVDAGTAITAAAIADGGHTSNGLASDAQLLCAANETTSGGSFACGAGLNLVTPASTATGTHQSTLTLTLA